MTEDEKFMKAALAQAKKAAAIDEVPIGCVIVYEGKIIARGYNKRNKEKNTLSHSQSQQISGRLAPGGMHDVYYTGTLSDVCRSNCSSPCGQSGDWQYECQSRLRRFCVECASGEKV